MEVAPHWSIQRLGEILKDLSLLAATAYGMAAVVGLPILWVLRQLRFLNAAVVTAIGISGGLFLFLNMAAADSQHLESWALAGGAIAAGPLAFSVLSGLPWRLARSPVELSAKTFFG
jgi:hypothetical protein